MPDVRCAMCGVTFSFDPATVWTSPGTLNGLKPGMPPAVVIQCPQCQQWVRVDLPSYDPGPP
jgi:hypothetical protein